MEYMDVVRDFAERTMENLKLIEELTEDQKKGYEVTQLINSMLGLLVFPQQRYYESIPETPLEQLVADGWEVPKVKGCFPQAKTMHELFRYLRNAIAHSNLEFIASRGEIVGVIVWNNNSKGEKTWMAEMRIEQLKSLTERFVKLLLKERLRNY